MHKHRARKRFGQHFLTDTGVIDEILHAIRPASDDIVVEIGPGPGAITVPVAARCEQLHAIEIDRDLAAQLRSRFAGNQRVVIHEADALDFDFAELASASGRALRIIGNLPYNISTPLLFHLLDSRHAILDMHFMLQKEVVDRMAAIPGSKKFGRLSIMLGCYLEIEALFEVEPQAFEPPPAVTSSVVRLRPFVPDKYAINDAGLLSSLVATAFSQRRKTLRNALKSMVSTDDLEALQINAGLRPENVPVADWVALANRLATKSDFNAITR
jgi:16S rRNA (adenine1518-N6/adenine1519-N6)-dimethyltransferase